MRKPVNPRRVEFARRRRGLTKKTLAASLGVTYKTISRWEHGEVEVPHEKLGMLADCLAFPSAFFHRDDPHVVDREAVSFRSLRGMSAYRGDAAVASASIAIELSEFLEQRFELPAVDFPDLRYVGQPEEAAHALRQAWGLGDRPIRNVVHLLERHGVRVFRLVEDCTEVDAFSFWWNAVPYVFLNTKKSPERSRFDACHELGHLVLHRHAPSSGREEEHEADSFSSAMLMPASSVYARVRPPYSLDGLVLAKKNWRVSLVALIQRLRSAGVLSEWHHRQLMIQAATKGYTRREPKSPGEEPPVWESSQVLSKAFAELASCGISRSDVAADLAIDRLELDALIDGLTMRLA